MTHAPRFPTSRIGITVTAVAGLAIAAAGLASAQDDGDRPPMTSVAATYAPGFDDGPAATSVPARSTTSTATPSDPMAEDPPSTSDAPMTTLGVAPSATAGDSPPTSSVDDSPPTTTVEVAPTTSFDDPPTTSVGVSPPTSSVDDGPPTTVEVAPTTSVDSPTMTTDDSPPTTGAAAPLAPFTRSFSSSGGSISVTWSGTSLTLNSVAPAPGFRAEIEDLSSSRVRVDFGGDDDARIEVRVDDGRLRVRID